MPARSVGFGAACRAHIDLNAQREEDITAPKQKTHKAAAKRLALTGTGKIKRYQAYKRHILTKKPTKRTRNLRKAAYVASTVERTMKKLIPYK